MLTALQFLVTVSALGRLNSIYKCWSESLLQFDRNAELHALLPDARRFLRYGRWIIDKAPLQTYSSVLVFTPQESLTRQRFRDKMPSWLRRLPKTRQDWSFTLQILEGHTAGVIAVALPRSCYQVLDLYPLAYDVRQPITSASLRCPPAYNIRQSITSASLRYTLDYNIYSTRYILKGENFKNIFKLLISDIKEFLISRLKIFKGRIQLQKLYIYSFF